MQIVQDSYVSAAGLLLPMTGHRLPVHQCPIDCAVLLLCRQARKLQEMFKALQQENDELKRRLGGGRGGIGGLSAPGNGLGSGGRTGQRSPFGAGAQMVSRYVKCNRL